MFQRARGWCAIVLAVSCAWLGRTGAARAAVTANVSLVLTGCAEAQVPLDKLFDLVRTEVSPLSLGLAGVSRHGEFAGTIALCYGSPDRVWVGVSGAQGNVERVVELADVAGELRIRTLAVTFAEMLTTLQARVAVATDSKATPSTSESAPAERRLAAASAENPRPFLQPPKAHEPEPGAGRVGIFAGGTLRQFASPSTLLAGPWLSIGTRRWRGEVVFLQASRQVSAGSVQLRELNVAAVVVPLQVGDALHLALGLRGEVGMNWASGTPDANRYAIGTTQRRVGVVLLAEPRLELALSPTVVAMARLAAGVAYGPTARANRDPVITSGGAVVGASLGLGARF